MPRPLRRRDRRSDPGRIRARQHRANGSRLHVERQWEQKGAGMANDDMDNPVRMPALSPCWPSSTEHVMGEWCERKEGEANVHWHYPTVHFIQKQLIMAG